MKSTLLGGYLTLANVKTLRPLLVEFTLSKEEPLKFYFFSDIPSDFPFSRYSHYCFPLIGISSDVLHSVAFPVASLQTFSFDVFPFSIFPSNMNNYNSGSIFVNFLFLIPKYLLMSH